MTVDKLNLAWSWKPRKVERKSVSSGSICRERRDTSIRVQSSSAEQSTGKHSPSSTSRQQEVESPKQKAVKSEHSIGMLPNAT